MLNENIMTVRELAEYLRIAEKTAYRFASEGKVSGFKVGSASLQAGSTTALSSIKDFGAKTYTEDEEKALSEIIDNFNQRHGTEFTKEDFLRFEQVNREILGDEDLREMLKNNPPDVVFGAFSHAFFEGAIKLFQKDKQLQNIVMSDAQAREQATRHFFSRALREVQSEQR